MALAKELIYQTSRSCGKGGQNVNKVASKVEVGFNILLSNLFNPEQKEVLLTKLQSLITNDNLIKVVCEKDRSQLLNKQKAIEKLAHLLEKSLKIKKQRKATNPSKASVEKRLKEKQARAYIKINRGRSFLE
ncbi:ribosome-associated protein [Solitalea koreensis]|uniref:Ribosome-associated protein n=2 Tax=Solitalea koreensis TaxID=543615 RepID=A0A521D1X5_9SPHI|nr:ribosome-associated protein [Solitalea koreensis]